MAQLIVEPALKLLAGAAIEPGMTVLDVATGTGNVAIPAAGQDASVVGLDLTPKLLEKARARAVATGVKTAWREGDAEKLPFADDSFDRGHRRESAARRSVFARHRSPAAVAQALPETTKEEP